MAPSAGCWRRLLLVVDPARCAGAFRRGFEAPTYGSSLSLCRGLVAGWDFPYEVFNPGDEGVDSLA